MSQDPKKPFDAPPGLTPSLLKKDMNLNRRDEGTRPTQLEPMFQPKGPSVQPQPAAARREPPSPTEWAKGQHQAAPPTERLATLPPPRAAASTLDLGDEDEAPTRIAPYNRPNAELPVGAINTGNTRAFRSSPSSSTPLPTKPGTAWSRRDPAAPKPPEPELTPPSVIAQRARVPAAPPPERLDLELDDLPLLNATVEPPPAPPPSAPEPVPFRAAALGGPAAKPARAVHEANKVATKAPSRPNEVQASPASVWRRTFSWVIDLALIAGLLWALLFAAVAVIGAGSGPLVVLQKIAVPAAALGVLIAFVYSSVFAFLWQGRTVGRRLFGIHLVDGSGKAPGPLRALFRGGLALVSFALFLSGFWLALFDRRGQTLHDKLSRTYVVRF